MSLDHVSLKVCDHTRSQAFYDQALAPIGVTRLFGGEGFSGYGADRPYFWIGQVEASETPTGAHVAFAVPTRDLVKAFHAAALAAGGRDNGEPGVRAHYHPDYYGAFVLDPDGHNIEAVCRAPA